MLLRLIERNLKLYLRDPLSVFFSFLSVLMVIIMYAVFLGDNTIANVRSQVGDVAYLDGLVYSWLMAGLVFMSTVTVPINVLSQFNQDTKSGAIYDFYAAPLAREHLILSYLISSIVVTTLMSLVNLLAGQLFLYSQAIPLMPFESWLRVVALIVVSASVFSSLFFLIALIMRGSEAFGSLGGIVGTLIGFFAGIYVPIGVMGESVRFGVNVLPFAQGVTLMRQAYMPLYLDRIFDGAPMAIRESFTLFYGVNLAYSSYQPTSLHLVLMFIGFGGIFFIISALLIKRQKVA